MTHAGAELDVTHEDSIRVRSAYFHVCLVGSFEWCARRVPQPARYPSCGTAPADTARSLGRLSIPLQNAPGQGIAQSCQCLILRGHTLAR